MQTLKKDDGLFSKGSAPAQTAFSSPGSLLNLLLANTSDCLLIIDVDLNIQLYNTAFVTLVKEALPVPLKQGISLLSITKPQYLKKIKKVCTDVFAGESREFEMFLEVPGRPNKVLRSFFNPAKNEAGAVVGAIITTQDITYKNVTELQLTESKQKLDLLLQNTAESFIILDAGFKIVLYNQSAARYANEFGCTFKIGASMLDVFTEPVEKEKRKLLYTSIFKGQTHEYEFSSKNKRGELRYFYNHYKPAYDNHQQVKAIIITIRDVTEKMIREETVLKNEERWRSALEGSNQGIWDWDIKKGTLHYSTHWKQLIGFEDNELSDTIEEWQRRRYPDDQRQIELDLQKHFDNTTPYYENIHRIKCKDNSCKWILDRGIVITKDHNGQPLRMLGTHTDLTELVVAKQKLEQSEEKYRHLFDNTPLPCLIIAVENDRILKANRHAAAFYGYNDEEFETLKIEDLWAPLYKEEQTKKLHEAILNQTFYARNWKHQKKSGEVAYVDVNSELIVYEGQKARLAIVKDISQQIQQIKTEEALRESNERLELAFQATSEVLWEWDIEHDRVFISPVYKDMFGFDINPSRKYEEWHGYLHPSDSEETIHSFYTTLDDPQKDRWEKEYRYMKSDGSYVHVIDHCIIQRDEQGKAKRLVGAMQDITNRKKAEEELLKSNERFRLAAKATSDAIYDWNLVNNQLNWGEGLQTLFGYQSEEVPITKWETLLHEDDRAFIVKSLKEIIANKSKHFWIVEYRFQKRDGTYRYILDRGYIVRDSDRKAVRMIGAMHDISEVKYSQDLLALERTAFELSNNPKNSFSFVIESLLKNLEAIQPDMLTSVSLMKPDKTVIFVVAPSLPVEYVTTINGTNVNGSVSSCGIAIHDKRDVYVPDINTGPLSRDYKETALSAGILSCWSLVIVDRNGNVLGTFAIYHKTVKEPTPTELNTVEQIRNILQVLMQNYFATEQIKISNERFDTVIEATHDLIWDWNLETGTLYRSSDGLKNVYGIEDGQSVQNTYFWLQRIHPDDNEQAQKIINDVILATEQDTFDVEYRFKRDDGTYSHVYDRGKIIRDAIGKPVRMIGAAQDITVRKKLEQELLNKELDRQKSISQATIETQEGERSEIGKELHDNVNQILTTTKLYLDLSKTNPDLKDDLIEKSSKNVIHVINEIRQLSRSLMNPSLGDLGLVDSIHDLISDVHITRKLLVVLKANKSIDKLLAEAEKLMIYRIIQEALKNAVKHAQASSVLISIRKKAAYLCLAIEDDGIGFETKSLQKGVGLNNIQNRVYLANGKLLIKSKPDKGCKIIIELPFKNTDKKQ